MGMPRYSNAGLYLAYVAVFAAVVPYVAFHGVKLQGLHEPVKLYGWPVAEWFRMPFMYAVFTAEVAAILAAVLSLLLARWYFLPALALALAAGFIAHEWSAFITVVCRAVGSNISCLG
jgi:hypothetical protein